MALALGCRHDVESRVGTHLFGISANNSGSTFLKAALATSRATWNLDWEGQMMLGYVGPNILWPHPAVLLWAAEQRWIDLVTDPGSYDWPRTCKAWYFQAFARDPDACVFYTKTPAHLLLVGRVGAAFPQREVPVHGAQPVRGVRGDLPVPPGRTRLRQAVATAAREPAGSRGAARRHLHGVGSAATWKCMGIAASSSPTRRCAPSRSGWCGTSGRWRPSSTTWTCGNACG